jgi:catabolite regulation protein CreA
MVDKAWDSLVYVATGGKIINGSPKKAIGTVPIMPWQR